MFRLYSILYVLSTPLAALPSTYGMPANPLGSFHEAQPDGTSVTLRLHGDPHDSWMTDEDDYTVVKDPTTGYFVYAQPDGNGGLEPSSKTVGNSIFPSKNSGGDDGEGDTVPEEVRHQKLPPNANSDSTSSAGSIGSQPSTSATSATSTTPTFTRQKNLRPTIRDCRNKICGEHHINHDDDIIHRERKLRGTNHASSNTKASSDNASFFAKRRAVGTATKSRLRNLVLLLRWSDHVDRNLPTREDYEVLINNEGPDPRLCPTGSVRDVFLENSYGFLEVNSYVTDWIPMDNTEEYYSNGDKGTTTRIQDAIRYALEYVDGQRTDENDDDNGHNKVDFDFFDEDRDGFIDSITFIHSGYAAEVGGTDSYGRFYEQRIWSHKWTLYYESFQSSKGRNVQVSNYHISSGLWGLEGSGIGRIGVIAHEMAHFLGLPDLYDYDSSSIGLGNYDLMANSWGSNGQQLHPPYLSAWTKMVLGWVTPIEPAIGKNIVEASAEQNPSHPQVYIVKEGFPEGEFLLIENRQPIGFDMYLPQGGLAIWHIDYGSINTYSMYDVTVRQSEEGYPEQEGWPENGNHYAVALLQADGYYDLEMGFNSGDYEDLFHASDVNELIPCVRKSDCQYPNTDSYQEGNVVRTNVHITDISESGDVMTFNYWVGEVESAPTYFPTFTPTFSPTSFLSSRPTPSPTTEEERQGRKNGRICRINGNCSSGYCKKSRRWLFKNSFRFFGKCSLPDELAIEA